MSRTLFSKALFQRLNDSRADYLLLKHTAADLDSHDAHSDLDILLPSGVNDGLRAFFEQNAAVDFVRWRRWADREAAFVHFSDGGFLQVDFLLRLGRKAWVYLPNRQLLAAKQRNAEGIVTYSDQFLLEHAALFSLLNHGGLSDKYCAHFSSLPEPEQERLTALFNYKYKTRLVSLVQLALFEPSVRRAVVAYLRQQPENNALARLGRWLGWLGDAAKALLAPAAPTVTFSGVDGAGKSTVLAAVRERLERDFRQNTVVLRHRPGLLPIISAWSSGRRQAEAKAAATLPHTGRSSSAAAGLARFGYYLFDYVFGQFWVRLRWQSRGQTVLYDRYFFDFMADPRRSNAAGLPAWAARLGWLLVKKPDLNIFLWAKPEAILSRKKELPRETIERLTDGYRGLFGELGRKSPKAFVAIENLDLEETVSEILKKINQLQRPAVPLRAHPMELQKMPARHVPTTA